MSLLMLGLFSFGGASMPAVQPALPAPTVDDPEVEEAKRRERELARRRQGRSGTILTGPTGLSEQTKDKATLLGG
jgi:hypothetical protein